MDILDELLNEEVSAMSYTDDELIVNADDRTIYIPNTLAGVTSDEKSTRLKLRCPRYVGDNIDLSTMNVYINFKNANGDIYSYLTDDVAVDGTDITFSWLLSRDVTTYKGNVNFIVCAKKIQADGKITIEWNTTLSTLTVLEGLEPADNYIPTEKVDVATELMNAVNAVKAELNGVKDSIPVIPTKVSAFENDRNYINTIPDEYVTEDELNAHANNSNIHVTTADRSKWNGKFDSNQGTSNAGKLLGTNSNGDVVAISGYGFEYDETTKMLKYGTDPTTNLNQGIGLDNTLSKKGYAAEASAVGELKSDLVNFSSGNNLDFIINNNIVTNVLKDTLLRGTDGDTRDFEGYSCTDFISLVGVSGFFKTPSTSNVLACFYDSDKQFIASYLLGFDSSDGYAKMNLPNNTATEAVFLRLSVPYNLTDSFYLIPNKDNTVKKYIPQKWIEQKADCSIYYGKKIGAIGDSITAQGKWFNQLSLYLGEINNYGVSGSTVSTNGNNGMCTDDRINAIDSDTEFLFVMGGVNDWAQNVPLGELSLNNEDTNTFYGACNVMIRKLYDRLTNCKIINIGCTYCLYSFTSSVRTEYNNLGLTTLDYGEAFNKIAKMNGMEYFNIGTMCQWNRTNISTYVQDDGAYIHPNQLGADKMAYVIKSKVN